MAPNCQADGEWISTPASTTATAVCPAGFSGMNEQFVLIKFISNLIVHLLINWLIGYKTRSCDDNGVWAAVDSTGLIQHQFQQNLKK